MKEIKIFDDNFLNYQLETLIFDLETNYHIKVVDILTNNDRDYVDLHLKVLGFEQEMSYEILPVTLKNGYISEISENIRKEVLKCTNL